MSSKRGFHSPSLGKGDVGGEEPALEGAPGQDLLGQRAPLLAGPDVRPRRAEPLLPGWGQKGLPAACQ